MAFIIKPLVTEKMTKITDKQPNRYEIGRAHV